MSKVSFVPLSLLAVSVTSGSTVFCSDDTSVVVDTGKTNSSAVEIYVPIIRSSNIRPRVSMEEFLKL